MQANGRRLDCLDTFRGIAILIAFVMHAALAAYGHLLLAYPGRVADFAHPPGDWTFYLSYAATLLQGGVPLFFVISGFCIHLSCVRSAEGWTGFFRRRAWRILPPYFAVLLGFALLWPGTRLTHWSSAETWIQFSTHLFLVHNLHPDTLLGINSAFWTVAIEVQLYLLYPALALLARKIGWRSALICLCGIEAVLRVAFVSNIWEPWATLPFTLVTNPLAYWGSWSLGAYLAERYTTNRPLHISAHWYWIVGALLLTGFHLNGHIIIAFPLNAALAFVLLARAVFPRNSDQVDRLLRNRNELPIAEQPVYLIRIALRRCEARMAKHLGYAGACSYSFYLIHMPLEMYWAAFCQRVTHVRSPFLLFLLVLPLWFVVLGLSRLLYRFLERPAMAMGKRMSTAAPVQTRRAA